MIFTDRFVYVHQPKTGGTFVPRCCSASRLPWTAGAPEERFLVNLAHRNRMDVHLQHHKHVAAPPSRRAAAQADPGDGAESLRSVFVALRFGCERREYDAGSVRICRSTRTHAAGRPRSASQQFCYFTDCVPPTSASFTPTSHEAARFPTAWTTRGGLAFIASAEILPQGKESDAAQAWERFYTPELKRRAAREHLLFTLFPHFDFDALRIIVLGYLVRGPLGGLAWHHLQYVLGLARLGHDVHFLEDSDDYPSCYDPSRDAVDSDPSYGLRFTAHAFDTLGMPDRWAYYDAHTSRWLGPAAPRALDICANAELLLNIPGVNPLRPWLAQVPHRAFIDNDPAFTRSATSTDPVAHALAWPTPPLHLAGNHRGVDGTGRRHPVAADATAHRPRRLARHPGPPDGALQR